MSGPHPPGPPAPPAVQLVAARARRRLVWANLVRRTGVALLVASAGALVAVLAAKALRLHIAPALLIGVPIASGALGGIIAAWWRRPTLAAAARRLDDSLRLKDRLGSALSLTDAQRQDEAFVALAIADAERLAAGVRAEAIVPLRWDRPWLVAPALAVAAALCAWLAPLGLWIPSRAAERAAAEAVEAPRRAAAGQQIAQARALIDPATTEPSAPEADPEALKALDEIDRELTSGRVSAAEATGRSAAVLEQAARRAERASEEQQAQANAVRERLASLPKPSTPADSNLARALRAADTRTAAEEARELAERLARMTPAEREDAARELEELARQLEAADNDANRPAEPSAAEKELARLGLTGDQIADLRDTPPPPGETEERLKQQGLEPETAQRLADALERERTERAEQQAERARAEELAKSLQDAARELRDPPPPPAQPPSSSAAPDSNPPAQPPAAPGATPPSASQPPSTPGDRAKSPEAPSEPPKSASADSAKNTPKDKPKDQPKDTPGNEPNSSSSGEQGNSATPRPSNDQRPPTRSPTEPRTPRDPAPNQPGAEPAPDAKSEPAKDSPKSSPTNPPSSDQAPPNPKSPTTPSATPDTKGQPTSAPNPPGEAPAPTPKGEPSTGDAQRKASEQPPSGAPTNTGVESPKGEPASPTPSPAAPKGGSPAPDTQRPDAKGTKGQPSPDAPKDRGATPAPSQPSADAKNQPNADPDAKGVPPSAPTKPDLSPQGLERLAKELERLQRDGAKTPADQPPPSEAMREQAREMLEKLSPDEREQLKKLAERLAERADANGSTGDAARLAPAPRPDGDDTNSPQSRRPIGAGSVNAPRAPVAENARTQDAGNPAANRAPSGRLNPDDRVVGEIPRGTGREIRAADADARARVVQEAAASAQRAIDDRVVPNRFAPAIRDYFKRLPAKLGVPSSPPAPATSPPPSTPPPP